MAKQMLIFLLVAMTCILCGCNAGNKFDPPRTTPMLNASNVVDLSMTTEVDLVEKVALGRQQYQQSLELLVDYYSRVGNDTRLAQARKELSGVKTMAHYTYIPDAYAPDASLKATLSIPEADTWFEEAEQMYRRASQRWPISDNRSLRLAMDKYAQLIARFQNSDKIDSAAFQIGEISRKLKDYNTSLLYYQRAYQWDAATPHPARFQAARLLDDYLARRDEALELYQLAIQLEGTQYPQWKEFAEKRIAELTDTAMAN